MPKSLQESKAPIPKSQIQHPKSEIRNPRFIPLEHEERSVEDMLQRSADFYQRIRGRRTVREFSQRQVPRQVIENCIRAAGTAPNGANRQPWHFVAVSNPDIKRRIRKAAEAEEKTFYNDRAPENWLRALEPFGTDADKPFLEEAPYLIVIFAQSHELSAEGNIVKNYYVQESVGIATGLLITAVHQAGLVSLTHTPSPMRFLNRILNRPGNERAFLILVVGYPVPDARVPDISKKPFEEIATFID